MARRSSKSPKNGQPWDELDAVDWAIINILIERPGVTDQEISNSLGYSRNQINVRRNNPALQLELRELQRDVIEKLKSIQTKAVRRLERIIDRGEDRDAKTAAATIIDGLPEVAAGLLKPNDDGDEPTSDQIDAIEGYLAEIKKRQAPNEGGAS